MRPTGSSRTAALRRTRRPGIPPPAARHAPMSVEIVTDRRPPPPQTEKLRGLETMGSPSRPDRISPIAFREPVRDPTDAVRDFGRSLLED